MEFDKSKYTAPRDEEGKKKMPEKPLAARRPGPTPGEKNQAFRRSLDGHIPDSEGTPDERIKGPRE